jgi:hypothetical protein
MLSQEIIELPGCIALRISNEDTLVIMRTQRRALVLLKMNISSTTPHSKMRNIRLASMPQLIRCGIVQGSSGTSVPNMHKYSQSFAPERSREARFMQHAGYALREQSITVFGDSILLTMCSRSMLAQSTTLSREICKCVAHILASLVIAQCL